jgi:hypothetical protein
LDCQHSTVLHSFCLILCACGWVLVHHDALSHMVLATDYVHLLHHEWFLFDQPSYISFTITQIIAGFQCQICGLFMTWIVHLGGGAQSGKTSSYLNWAMLRFVPW